MYREPALALVDAPHPPSPPDRPAAHRIATAALAFAWKRVLLPEPDLDPGALKAAARAKTGLDDFGKGWEPAFEMLVEALVREAELNPLGRAIAYGQLRRILCQRLRAVALWRRHPDILERPLAPPVIVLGQMRSGTTRLQRLLACDPLFLNSSFSEVFSPILPRGPDWRRLEARLCLATMHALNPRLPAIHPTGASTPDEQYGLFNFSFYGAQLEAQWRVPSFARWWRGQDRTHVYAEFRRLIQTIGWSRGDDPARPWLLKAPQFMEDLAPLLAAFPGARLIRLHRDPVAVVGSSASLVWNQMLIQSDSDNRRWIGREWLDKTAYREESAGRCGAPRLDLQYADMDRDWRAELRRIYTFLGRPFTAELEARMQRYIDAAQAQGFDRHSYQLEDFGLTAPGVRARLAKWCPGED